MSERTDPFSLGDDFAPTKPRGQNFLVDPGMADKMVRSLNATREDTVFEVGPGTGALTERLLAVAGHVIAVETDRALAEHLRTQFGNEPRLTLIEQDFLTVDLSFLKDKRLLKGISNLPYSITSPAMFRFLTAPAKFDRLVFTMQKEVALCLTAKPGSKTYGRMSVLVALAGKVEGLFDLPPQVFRPRPNVVSRAIAIVPARDLSGFPGSHLERTIKAAFSQRRKQAASALAAGLAMPRAAVDAALASCGIKPTARAYIVQNFSKALNVVDPKVEIQVLFKAINGIRRENNLPELSASRPLMEIARDVARAQNANQKLMGAAPGQLLDKRKVAYKRFFTFVGLDRMASSELAMEQLRDADVNRVGIALVQNQTQEKGLGMMWIVVLLTEM